MTWCCASSNDGFPVRQSDGLVLWRAVKKTRRLGSRLSLIAALFFLGVTCASANPMIIGSKKFTESYVLGEIAKRTLNDAGIPAEHRQGMGGTIILWQALRGGQIDAYPEYTGTITQEILKRDDASSLEQIRESLGKLGVGMTEPPGLNNTSPVVRRR